MDNEVKEIMESYIKQRGAAPAYVEALAEMNPEILKDSRAEILLKQSEK